jgi:hypothetical protein
MMSAITGMFKRHRDVARSAADEIAEKYNELLFAVARNFPNETRHQTALRYINEAEVVSCSSGQEEEK